MIKVLFFASLRESLQYECDSENFLLLKATPAIKDIAGLRSYLATRGALWKKHLLDDERLLFAVNQEVTQEPHHPIKDGDEVAFFPPVTGG